MWNISGKFGKGKSENPELNKEKRVGTLSRMIKLFTSSFERTFPSTKYRS